jgi:lipoprotein-releasing system permease protein
VYQALLTRRYLTSKVMPLLAAVAVTLCVAMELIVWSVMGGFLVMLVESGRTLIGDVAISYGSTGFGHYDDLIQRLEKDPSVAAAAPMIESYGLLSLPLGGQLETVMIKGVDERFDGVTGYRDTLWWKPLETPLPKDTRRQDPRLNPAAQKDLAAALQNGLTLTAPGPAGQGEGTGRGGGRPALVVGVEVGGYNSRMIEGYLDPLMRRGDTLPLMLREPSTLSVLPQDLSGRALPEQVTLRFPVVNQFRTGLYEVDANTILVRLDALQRMLKMDEGTRAGPPRLVIDANGDERFEQSKSTVKEPARVTNVLVKAKPGINADQLKERCRQIYEQFAAANMDQPQPPPDPGRIRIQTWRDRNKTLIDAVENETGLVLFIFGIISVTSVFLVLAIFWAMVSEKTKDIGILRAIGASRAGVAWIWLRYGLVIGLAGALLGGGIAYLIVTNINPIHEWLGLHLGIVIWNPKVYYFTTIPHRVEWPKALIVMAVGVVASVVGSMVPALKAAFMDPVKSLRFE